MTDVKGAYLNGKLLFSNNNGKDSWNEIIFDNIKQGYEGTALKFKIKSGFLYLVGSIVVSSYNTGNVTIKLPDDVANSLDVPDFYNLGNQVLVHQAQSTSNGANPLEIYPIFLKSNGEIVYMLSPQSFKNYQSNMTNNKSIAIINAVIPLK